LPHIGVARLEMDETGTSAVTAPVTPKARAWRELTAWTAAALLGVVAIFLGWRNAPQDSPGGTMPPARLELTLPNPFLGLATLELSPDGRSLAYYQRSTNVHQLAILNLETLATTVVPGSEFSTNPFWSPDSQAIGFCSLIDGKLKIAALGGGVPRGLQIGDLAIGDGGASWAPDGSIVFASENGIFKTDQTGGNVRQLTHIGGSRMEKQRYAWPRFLSDGRRFLYTVENREGTTESVYVASIDGGVPRLLVNGSAATYLSGHLFYVRGGQLLVQACDEMSLEPAGQPILVANGVGSSGYSVSAGGLVVYRSINFGNVCLVEYDRSGRELHLIGEPGMYRNPVLSPDQTRILLSMQDGSGMQERYNLFILQLNKGALSRFTFGGSENDPVWSPDGRQVAYSANRENRQGLYVMDAIPGGKERPLLASEVLVYPNDWSPDGKSLIYTRIDPKTTRDLWMLSLPDGKASVWLQTPGTDDQAVFSPDGRWIAYASSESGESEVYIRPRSGSGGQWQVSTGGGRQPRWRGDGRELFFSSGDGMSLLSASIESGPSLEVDTPRKLFDMSLPGMSRSQWVVTKDGQRFIVETLKEYNSERLGVLTNWRALVREYGQITAVKK
jgi:eukaryotic-like serine/threonine-protein kinase